MPRLGNVAFCPFCPQGGPIKWSHKLIAIILSYLNRFSYFFTGIFPGTFAMKSLLKLPPHFAYACCPTTVWNWNINVRKQAINDKLQGSVATYLGCGGAVSNQIKKGLLSSVPVKNNFESVNIWQSYKRERDCLVHFVRLAKRRRKCTRQTRCYDLFTAHDDGRLT